jgi:AraC family transcriptional regulator of arabinose operon
VLYDAFRSGHFYEDASYSTHRPKGGAEWLLILTVAGRGTHTPGSGAATVATTADLRAAAEPVALEPGTALLYAPGVPQHYATDATVGHWELLWAHFAAEKRLRPLLEWPPMPCGAALLDVRSVYSEVETAMLEVVRQQAGGLVHRHHFVVNGLERALLWCDTVNPQSERGRMDSRVTRVLEMVARGLGDRIDMQTMAHDVGLSRSRLSHLFAAEVGMSFPEYVESRRMERAQDLLRMTDQPIALVADAVGYPDALYFSRRFKRAFGVSPRTWRATR